MGGQPCNNNCRSPLLPLKRNPKHERAAAPYSGASWFDYCALFYGILKNAMLAPYIVGVSWHTAEENPRSQMDARQQGWDLGDKKGAWGERQCWATVPSGKRRTALGTGDGENEPYSLLQKTVLLHHLCV